MILGVRNSGSLMWGNLARTVVTRSDTLTETRPASAAARVPLAAVLRPLVAAPAPLVPKTMDTTLNTTLPLARAGSSFQVSQASRPLPVSLRVLDKVPLGRPGRSVTWFSISQVGVSARPSLSSPPQDCFRPSQPPNPTRLPRPLTVPHRPSTTTPLPKETTASKASSYQGLSRSSGLPQGTPSSP